MNARALSSCLAVKDTKTTSAKKKSKKSTLLLLSKFIPLRVIGYTY